VLYIGNSSRCRLSFILSNTSISLIKSILYYLIAERMDVKA